MTDKIELKINEVIQFLNLLSADEQDRFLKKIQKSLSPKRKKKEEKKRKPLLIPSPKISDVELNKMKRKGIPSLGNIDEAVKKRRLKKEQLEPFKELFKDELSAEELIKLL